MTCIAFPYVTVLSLYYLNDPVPMTHKGRSSEIVDGEQNFHGRTREQELCDRDNMDESTGALPFSSTQTSRGNY